MSRQERDAFVDEGGDTGTDSERQKTGSRRWTRWRWKNGGKLEERRNAGWLDQTTNSWLGPGCFTREISHRTVRSRNTNVDLSLKRSGGSKG